MKNGLTPDYLSSFFPSSVGETAIYNLRNASDIQTIRTSTSYKTTSFKKHEPHIQRKHLMTSIT